MPDHMNDGGTSGEDPVLMVGAGRMGVAYAAVMRELGRPLIAIGRGEDSAKAFDEATGLTAVRGGLDAWLGAADAVPGEAIIAAPVETLAQAAGALIDRGVRRLLVEKPAGVDAAELAALRDRAAGAGAEVFVAYNRRFYDSVTQAKQMIEEDGGPVSVAFEFTEVSDIIASSGFAPEVKANWVLANSTHVIDTAYFLAGFPVELVTRVAGSLAWHPAAARFAGTGLTDRGAVVSYCADWDAPGRWGVEVMTTKRRFVLRPMEKLAVQVRGSFAIEPVEPADDADARCKPGLLRQTEAFLKGLPDARLVTLADHASHAAGAYAAMVRSGAWRSGGDAAGRSGGGAA